MRKYKAGDKVKVLQGKDKGREGEIEKILLKKDKAIVPGLNVYKKHVKGAPGRKGGIYEVPRPIQLSKLAVICPKCKKATRVGFKMSGNEKVRVCKKCGREMGGKGNK